ncbi:FadR family transcriptional regulator [Puteibacter caeruleilacunae]|nr:FadR family transcriptional regulator [Puteibacter caeruleilacunae]
MEDIFGKIGTTVTLSQKIERKIEEAIRSKKLPLGAKLPSEKELCESFAVSRTALREALRRLSARGLIEIKKGSGMYVSEIKIEDAISSLNLYYDLKFDSNLISHIIEVRYLFEPEMARMAAKNRAEEDLLLLSENIKFFKQCDADNTQLEVDTDNKFHLTIAKATHNPVIILSMEPIYSLLPRMRDQFYGNLSGEKAHTIEAHEKIYNAIKDQDSDRAYFEMKKHVDRTWEVYKKHFEK